MNGTKMPAQAGRCIDECAPTPCRRVKDVIIDNFNSAQFLREKLTRLEAALLPTHPDKEGCSDEIRNTQDAMEHTNTDLIQAMNIVDRLMEEFM